MIQFHTFFSTRYANWDELELAINQLATPQEKGEVFEQFVYAYLHLHADYYQIKELYRLKDLPAAYRQQLELENTDYGVDGVWLLTDGTFAAYQAKFREARQSPTVRELATFWAEARKADHKYVIANSNDLPKQANKHGYSVLVDKFGDLDSDFFDNLARLYAGQQPQRPKPFTPIAHQQRMIDNIVKGFEAQDRGKLTAACGAGKTLVALWTIESLGAKRVLFLAPSLALIKQTLESWKRHAKNPQFAYLCVCSDKSVVSDVDPDSGDYDISEVDFPVTTDPTIVSAFLQGSAEYKFMFTTYTSAPVIAEAMKGSASGFDIAIFDEAHRTAGQKRSNTFSAALHDDAGIAVRKRLFMTATERLVRPWIIERAQLADRVVFSMDDEAVYGPTFARYSFGEAISDGVISDYKIVLAAVDKEEVAAMIRNNDLLVTEDESTELMGTAQNIFKQIVLAKAMRQFGLTKTITFHSSVVRVRSFIYGSSRETFGLEDLMTKIWPELSARQRYFDYVDGQMPAGLRKTKLREFENTDFAVMANAKCLTEGIDVPIIDSVYFVDPKTSLVDIVQACGRALRKARGSDRKAHFIVPVLLYPEDGDPSQIDDSRFETLLNLVQALRDQDERLADWIDQLNLSVVRGGSLPEGGDSPISIDLPKWFDVARFSKEVSLRILEANSGPINRPAMPELHIRKSSHEKKVKPLVDYSVQSLFDSLVDPTIIRFIGSEDRMPRAAVKINNNNLSHATRVGLIEKHDEEFALTALGKRYKNRIIDRDEVMRLAMLDYNCGDTAPLYPYRAILELLLRVGSLNYVEFLYGVYTLADTSRAALRQAERVIVSMRATHPNVVLTADANKQTVLDELNARYGGDFSLSEVWGSTTTSNKFIYFRVHLCLFKGIGYTNGSLVVLEESKADIEDLLEASKIL